MIPALLFFIATTFIVSKVGNIGRDAYILVSASLIQYICYFFILKRVFSEKKAPVFLITATALICFSLFLYAPPKLSNDVYRYFWDGLMQKSGYNPYNFVPGDWALHDLQEANMGLFKHVDWRDKFTPYPPFAQYIFRGAYFIYSELGVPGGKFVFALPFILSAAFIYFFLDKKIYAAFILNPLLLLEIVANAHLDGWVILFILAAMYLWHKEKYVFSSLFWVLAVATKVYPVFFAPYLVFDLIRKKKFSSLIISAVISVSILYLLYLPFIRESLFPITRYLTLPNEQEYNASIYRYLYQLMGMNTPGVGIVASKMSTGIFALVSLFLLSKRYSVELLFFVSLFYLLCSPIVFPWYSIFLFSFAVMIAWKNKSPRIFYFFAFMQFIITCIYLEPGKWILRETMLNIEYFLLLVCIFTYIKTKHVKIPSLFYLKKKAFAPARKN